MGTTRRPAVEKFRNEMSQELRKEISEYLALRLRNALVETLRDKAQKDKGGGKATLLAAKRLKEAVDKALKERGVKDAVVAMVNR